MKAVRMTRAGGLLVEFEPDAANKDSFRGAVRKVLGEKAAISLLEPMVILEIRDIDCATDVNKVKETLKGKFPEANEVRVRIPQKTTEESV